MVLWSIFKDSLKFPMKNLNKLLFLFILFSFLSLVNSFILPYLDFESFNFILFMILNFIIVIFIYGYLLEVIKFSIKNRGFDLSNNLMISNDNFSYKSLTDKFINGLEVFILSIIFYLVPNLLMTSTSTNDLAAIIYSYFYHIFYFIGGINESLDFGFNYGSLSFLWDNFPITYSYLDVFTVLLVLILFMIATTFFINSKILLANSGSLKDSLSFKQIWNVFRIIGFKNYVLWLIVMFLVVVFVTEILFFIILPFYYYWDFVLLFVVPVIMSYFLLFNSRAIGLLYSDDL